MVDAAGDRQQRPSGECTAASRQQMRYNVSLFFFWSVMILPLLLLLPVLLISCARRARAPGRDRPLLLVSA
jgi:hypothetical protein